MVNVYGGDTVETASGRTGRVSASRFSLIGKETEYILDRDDSAPVLESEIVRIVAHGQHDYRPSKSQRGHCDRCGTAKKDHN